jgi:thiol:disulfide interchange protein DsbD
VQNRLQSGERRGLAGAFIVGLALGPLSAPCVGPVIGSVLVNIAQKGQVAAGALQLFTFALGMGVLFVAVGTFTAVLPKSGDWLVKLKQVMGVVVLAFAVWTLRYVIPGWASAALWSLELLLAAALLGAFEPAEGLLASFAKGLAWLALLVGLLLGVRAAEQGFGLQLLPQGGAVAAEAAPAWRQAWMEQDLDAALKKAQAEHKVVLVDTYADWCAQCHELDEKTWPDAQVQAWIREHAVAVRINTDAVRPDLAQRLQVRSYPTVLLLDAEGKELKRVLGFQNPQAMLGWLNS